MMGLEQYFFYIDPLAISVGLCITFFTVLTLLYSWGYVPRGKGRILYECEYPPDPCYCLGGGFHE